MHRSDDVCVCLNLSKFRITRGNCGSQPAFCDQCQRSGAEQRKPPTRKNYRQARTKTTKSTAFSSRADLIWTGLRLTVKPTCVRDKRNSPPLRQSKHQSQTERSGVRQRCRAYQGTLLCATVFTITLLPPFFQRLGRLFCQNTIHFLLALFSSIYPP